MFDFNDPEDLLSCNPTMDELLSQWSHEIDDAFRSDSPDLFGAAKIPAYDEPHAIAGANDPDRESINSSQPQWTQSIESTWSWDTLPVPHVPMLPESALTRDRQPAESSSLTPFGSSAPAVAALQSPDIQTPKHTTSTTDEHPFLTTGA